MGNGADHIEAQDTRSISTMLLILVMLADSAPTALSTYKIGLAVTDDKEPPRPISVLIKALSHDGYVRQQGRVGKRAALWTITDRGLSSLKRRRAATAAARRWLESNPNHSPDEIAIIASLSTMGPQAASRLAETCDMLHSPVRTALKKLALRGFVHHRAKPVSEYALSPEGMRHYRQSVQR